MAELYDEGFRIVKNAKEVEAKNYYGPARTLYSEAVDIFSTAIDLETNIRRCALVPV